jgi:hypothetical protein
MLTDPNAPLRQPISAPFNLADPASNQFAAVDLTQFEPFTLTLACGPGLPQPQANGRGGGNGEPNNNLVECPPNPLPDEQLLRFGAFKAQGLRTARFTGPYLHNGGKDNIRKVLEFYKNNGDFPGLNLNNMDAGMRIFELDAPVLVPPGFPVGGDETAVVELIETGITDWEAAYERGRFGHPEICIPHGHDPDGKTVMVGIPAVGASGNAEILQTFEEHLNDDTGPAHDFTDDCTVPGLASAVAAVGTTALDSPVADPVIGFDSTAVSSTTVTGTITDALTVVEVQYSTDSGSWTSLGAPGGSAPNWTWSVVLSGEGNHTLMVTALDAAGNVATSADTTVSVILPP